MKKSLIIILAIIFSVGMVLFNTGSFAAENDTYKIGCVFPFSGPYGIFGKFIKSGLELAVEHHGGEILGTKIELIFEDNETKPQVAVQKTNKLLAGGADLILGTVHSGSTLAMMKVIAPRKVPHIVLAGGVDDRITGKEKTRYTFRTSSSIPPENKMVVEFIRERGFKGIYSVCADYGVTRNSWQYIKSKVNGTGVKIVGEDWPAIGTQDYSVIIDKIAKSGAEAVCIIMAGRDTITFAKQAAQSGLKDKVTIFGPTVFDEITANAAGSASLGCVSATRYHYTLDYPANVKFVTDFRKKYNRWPNQIDGDAYNGLAWWLNNVKKTGSFDKEKLIDAFEKSVWEDSVKGKIYMLSCNHQAAQLGMWGHIVLGTGDQPKYFFKVTKKYPGDKLYQPCPN